MSKLSTVIAATLLIAAGAASAQTTESTPLTREQVVAELAAARNSGELAALQGEKGVEVTTPAAARAAAVATAKLPRQAVLVVRPTDLQVDQKTAAAEAADHGENAARELGDFPAPVGRRATALAGR
jgi:mannose-1-phosphate guanylyltransferase